MSGRRELSINGLPPGNLACKGCGVALEDEQRRGRKREWCSDKCRANWRRRNEHYTPPAFVGSYDLLPEHIKKNFIPGDPDECWIYARRSSNGYATNTSVKCFKGSAYRLIYMMLIEPIPEGLTLDHLCDNGHGGCVNPNHLWPCTQQENVTRPPHTQAGRHMRATHCKHGHEFTPENTGTWVKGKRYCLTCQRERNRRYVAEGRARVYSQRHRDKKKAGVV